MFRTEFYELYKKQAGIFDKELKEYNKELNVTLVFVSGPVRYINPARVGLTRTNKFAFRPHCLLWSLQHSCGWMRVSICFSLGAIYKVGEGQSSVWTVLK